MLTMLATVTRQSSGAFTTKGSTRRRWPARACARHDVGRVVPELRQRPATAPFQSLSFPGESGPAIRLAIESRDLARRRGDLADADADLSVGADIVEQTSVALATLTACSAGR